jgi:hypothetical protein
MDGSLLTLRVALAANRLEDSSNKNKPVVQRI